MPLPWVRLRAAETSIRADHLLADPVLSALATDDLCWEIAWSEWVSCEPHRWRFRRLARWRSRGEPLQAERDRIRALARACGLPVA